MEESGLLGARVRAAHARSIPETGDTADFRATRKAAHMNRQARAAAPPGEDWPPWRWAEKQALAYRALAGQAVPIGERALRIVLWKDRLDAETAHTPQQRDLRLPRRLPAAAEAVPGRVGAVVGGDRPSTRHLFPQPETLEGQGGPPILRHQMALLELAEEPGLGHLFTDWTIPHETRDEPSAPGVPPLGRSPGRKGARRRGSGDCRGGNAKGRIAAYMVRWEQPLSEYGGCPPCLCGLASCADQLLLVQALADPQAGLAQPGQPLPQRPHLPPVLVGFLHFSTFGTPASGTGRVRRPASIRPGPAGFTGVNCTSRAKGSQYVTDIRVDIHTNITCIV